MRFVELLHADLMTCLYLSSISVDWSSVENQSSGACGPTAGCFHGSLVYLCTSYGQLVECRNGRLSNVVDLPFNDGISVQEMESATRSKLFIVQSRRNVVAVVDVNKHQVLVNTCVGGHFSTCSCPVQTLEL